MSEYQDRLRAVLAQRSGVPATEFGDVKVDVNSWQNPCDTCGGVETDVDLWATRNDGKQLLHTDSDPRCFERLLADLFADDFPPTEGTADAAL